MNVPEEVAKAVLQRLHTTRQTISATVVQIDSTIDLLASQRKRLKDSKLTERVLVTWLNENGVEIG